MSVSTTADIDGLDDEIIAGAKYGYALMQRSNGRLNYIKEVWDERDGPGKDKRYRLYAHSGAYLLLLTAVIECG